MSKCNLYIYIYNEGEALKPKEKESYNEKGCRFGIIKAKAIEGAYTSAPERGSQIG